MKAKNNFIKRKVTKLYQNSNWFRNMTNSLGIGVSSSFLYGASLGGCPCCAGNLGTCVVGVTSVGFVGLVIGFLSFIITYIKQIVQKIWQKINWKGKRLSN